VEHRLIAAECDDPIQLVQERQRVAVAEVALVQLQPRGAQRRLGVAEERVLEVVKDGDPGDARRLLPLHRLADLRL
jgi:hypothetical protein